MDKTTPRELPGLTLTSDAAAAQWILERVVEDTFQVRMTVPDGFQRYARIFYPFVDPRMSWSEVARRNGRRPHAEMELETIAQPQAGGPMIPSDLLAAFVSPVLPEDQFAVVATILRRHTETPSKTYFCIWEGYGDAGLERPDAPTFRIRRPSRNYLLYEGPLDAWRAFSRASHTPEYWWPEDKAWCFATDTDFRWAYVGAARECIDELTGSKQLDAIETRPDNRAHYGMDSVNDPEHLITRPPSLR